MGGRLPDFLGLGVQKGGTTTLQRLLEQHPGASLPPGKELHFFSLHHERGEAWYRQQFLGASPQQLCGEITPYYIFHPLASQRIHALVPEALLIVLLRDPVDRCLSQYFHARRLGLEPLELEQALQAEEERLIGAEAALAKPGGRHFSHQEHSYLARSRYEEQLGRYAAVFGPERLLLLRSEDLFTQPELIWEQVQGFLGLEPVPLPEVPPANVGAGEATVVSPRLRAWLQEQLIATYKTMETMYGLCW